MVHTSRGTKWEKKLLWIFTDITLGFANIPATAAVVLFHKEEKLLFSKKALMACQCKIPEIFFE